MKVGENKPNPELDSRSRKRIVSDIGENFFVEAGAGSGKTTMLVRRMVAMVEAGADISRICAITFTKAAAGEFYERFQRLLIERSRPAGSGEETVRPGMLPEPTDKTRELCRKALQDIDLCFMGTIDAFCGMVLSEHPTEARIPSDAAIVSDEDAAAIYRQEYVRICRGEYGGELQSLARAFQMLHRDAQDVFVKGISFVMNNRNVRFRFDAAEEADADRDFEQERNGLIRTVEFLMSHKELKYEKEKKSLAAWERIGEIDRNIRRRWSRSYTNVLYSLEALKNLRLIPEAGARYAVSLGDWFAPGGAKGRWLECTVGQKGGLLEKLEKYQYDVTMTFLVRSIPVMEDALREKGSLTFFDYLYYLRNMLRRDAGAEGKLIRYIYGRHSYFLIDEFQDTNPMQAEVFFYLCAEHPVPQWSACIPRPGSLFIVGDPKQSIYRFRSADVTSFLKVKRLFEKNGGSILSLSRNFRSVRTLCEYYNKVFRELLPEETDNQSKFELIPLPEPAEGEFQGVYTYTAYTGAAAEEMRPGETDPVRIADIIQSLVGREAFLIRGEGQKALRPIQYRDIMVITYGKQKLGPIVKELDRRDIPTKVEGDVPFSSNRALCELSLIYAAVADAGDTLALYGALTGGLIALKKEDILQFKACGGTVSLKADFDRQACREEAAVRTAEQIERLKALHARALRLSPAALYSAVMEEYRLYRTAPAENMEVVYYALELIRNAERAGQIATLKDGSAYIRSLISDRSGEERCLSLTADKDCVHMANLHKVKGLEAPVVILAAAGNRPSSVKCRMIHGDNGSEGYLFSMEGDRDGNGRSRTLFSTPEYAEEKATETEALQAEEQRLIYVAATRARNVLILCRSKRLSAKGEREDSRWAPVMNDEIPDILALTGKCPEAPESREQVMAAELYEKAERTAAFHDRSAEEESFCLASPSRLQVRSKLSEAPEVPDGEDEAEPAGETSDPSGHGRLAALLGTMAHRLMEMLVSARNAVDVRAAVGEILREYRTPDSEEMEDRLGALLLRVAERIRSGGYPQCGGMPQDILGTLLSADEVYCEIPFSWRDESEGTAVWHGVMDVVYSSGGKWHIVDYKTNADGKDLDVKYKAQLEAYVRAFRAITNREADAGIYHIDI